jgi:hypothetical protein
MASVVPTGFTKGNWKGTNYTTCTLIVDNNPFVMTWRMGTNGGTFTNPIPVKSSTDLRTWAAFTNVAGSLQVAMQTRMFFRLP